MQTLPLPASSAAFGAKNISFLPRTLLKPHNFRSLGAPQNLPNDRWEPVNKKNKEKETEKATRQLKENK